MLYSAETPIEEQKKVTTEEISEVGTDWLMIARDAHDQGQSYFDSSIRKDQEKAQAHFNNKHAPGSKYHSDSYMYRAKGFRPKTRSIIRKNEAAAAKAFFSTEDVVHIQAENESDPFDRVSAEITHEIVNYRLKNSIPWFTTLVGAYQDTLVSGVCISHQYWNYQEQNTPVGVFDEQEQPVFDETGQPAIDYKTEVLQDKPVIELRPIENIIFSPGADWQDPIGTSPYLIDKIPMTIADVKAMIEENDWHQLSDGQLQMGIAGEDDSIRAQREGSREDSKSQKHSYTDFDITFIHRNIIKKDGKDWIYYTLGTHHLLSDPVPLTETEEYKHLKQGQRPYVLGYSILETHKNYPSSLSMITSGLQQEANDINNQRRDNVSLVLNRRYYVRRGSKVDYRSLTRNIPGSITLMDDVNTDIRVEAPPEVTGSSYQEQDRVNMDYDELAGAFSTSSISSNRQLNETVGGMSMLQSDSNEMIEYQIRLFAETWVEPVLKQLVQMEHQYETNEALLSLMGEKIRADKRYGIHQITEAWLQGEMTVQVNVGFGATNPQKRIEKLSMGLNSIGTFAPQVIQKMDEKEVITEIMGALGYKSAERFFPFIAEEQEEDPRIGEMQQVIQQLQQQLQSKQLEVDGRIKVAQINAQADMQQEAIRNEGKAMEAQINAQLAMTRMQMERELELIDKQLQQEKNQFERGKLLNARQALLFKMRQETQNIMNDEISNPDNRQSAVIANDRYQMIPGQIG